MASGLSQNDMLTRTQGAFQTRSRIVQKKDIPVFAKKAVGGEVIKTVTTINGKLETMNVAEAGDYIVRNPTGEKYIIKADLVESKLQIERGGAPLPMGLEGAEALQAEGFLQFLPRGDIRLCVEVFPEDVPASGMFRASWGVDMVVESSDFLIGLGSSTGLREIYRVQRDHFLATYDFLDEEEEESLGFA